MNLYDKNIALIEGAQQDAIEGDYVSILQRGKDLGGGRLDDVITAADKQVEAYEVLAGLSGVKALQ